MLQFIAAQREKIGETLAGFLKNQKKSSGDVPWISDVTDRLIDFTRNGKMLRGSLILFSVLAAGGRLTKGILHVAAAFELFHAGLLIHDDVMDRDEYRRGRPALFMQYAALGKKKGIADPRRFGESMAICAGDIAFYWAINLINGSGVPRVKEILNLFTAEMGNVALGQMADVQYGSSPQMPAEWEIRDVYKYKTARYTFVLPLLIGAIIAGDSKNAVSYERLGEALGILFQMKDDELGLFGDTGEIGKPTGSDLREGKRTVLHHYLLSSLRGKDLKRFRSILGNPRSGASAVKWVRDIAGRSGAQDKSQKKMSALARSARRHIHGLRIPSAFRKILEEFVDYNLNRVV